MDDTIVRCKQSTLVDIFFTVLAKYATTLIFILVDLLLVALTQFRYTYSLDLLLVDISPAALTRKRKE